jgi:3-oxoacyl-[acyl-carrier protein] reductase
VCDVTEAESADRAVRACVGRFERLDILVNNAGITRDGLLIRMKPSEWDDVLRVNLSGAFHFTRAAARVMMKQRTGRIISVSSVVGLSGNAGQANYAASKAGLIGFTKSLAQELGSRGITVNAIAPGFIKTDMTAGLDEDQTSRVMERIPVGELGDVLDVAGAACYLASDAARYVTGQVLQVDGGLRL